MFFVFFPQEFLFQDAGHSVHSSVLVVEKSYALHFNERFSFLDNKFSTELIIEEYI